MAEAEKATKQLYGFVCSKHPSDDKSDEIWLGRLPYAGVKPFLHSDLLSKVEKALALHARYVQRFPSRKPLMIEVDFLSGFLAPPKKFEIQQALFWGDNVVFELRLFWGSTSFSDRWQQSVWVHWRPDNGKMRLSEIKWPGDNIERSLDEAINFYEKGLAGSE